MSCGRDKIKAAKKAPSRRFSRISEAPNGALAVHAADNDDFVTIAKHRLLRRKSLRVILPPELCKTIYEITRDELEHVERRTSEELDRERKMRELQAEDLRKQLELQDWERARQKREEIERQLKVEEDRLAAIREEEERRRLEKVEKERLEREEEEKKRLEKEEEERLEREEEEKKRLQKEEEAMLERKATAERERVRREAEERRALLEKQRQEADEEVRRKRKADYQRKIDAVTNAISDKERDQALKAVGKLTMLDFNNQEEWERHKREVGKLNILEIAGNFKRKGRRQRKERHKTQTIFLSNAKSIISKFRDTGSQEEVIRFVKPIAVDLSDIGLFRREENISAHTLTAVSTDPGSPVD